MQTRKCSIQRSSQEQSSGEEVHMMHIFNNNKLILIKYMISPNARNGRKIKTRLCFFVVVVVVVVFG